MQAGSSNIWKSLERHELRAYSSRQNIEQTEAAIGAAMSSEPVMPPEGIDPLRWAAMVKSMRDAIANNCEEQI
jgi:hypothetical protein